jgi:hypothetical protein
MLEMLRYSSTKQIAGIDSGTLSKFECPESANGDSPY